MYLANSNLNLFLNNSINEKVSVSIVQGNSPCPGAKNNCNDERKRIYESHLNLTRSIQNDKDLIIWPESSTGFRNDPLIHERVFCLLYTSPSPRDRVLSRMPSSA